MAICIFVKEKKVCQSASWSDSLAGVWALWCVREVSLNAGGWPVLLRSETCLLGKPHALPVGSLSKNCSDFPHILPQCRTPSLRSGRKFFWEFGLVKLSWSQGWLGSAAGIRCFKRGSKEGARRELTCHCLVLLSSLIPSGLAKPRLTWFCFPSRWLQWLYKFSWFC